MFRLGRRFHLPLFTSLALLLSILSPISFTQASAAPALVTCVNLQTGAERISHTGSCRNTQEAQANWRKNQSDSAIGSGASAKVITICSNKESSPVTYQVIRSKCAKHQVTTIFSRSGSLPSKPIIAEAVSFGYDSASLKLANDPAATQDAPIAYYTITSYKADTGTANNILTQRIYSWTDLGLAISGLQAQTTYTFTVSATTVDGTSQLSLASMPVTTRAYIPPATTTSLAAPAFTLSKMAETTTAFINLAGFGYTISSTGGAIASYALTGTLPAGLSFSTSTGLITGTPTETKTATTYTITATNGAGSSSATYRLRVTGDIGDIGPGGGKIFYRNAAGFTETGTACASACHYLESAPITGTSAWTDVARQWATITNTLVPGAVSSFIGGGYQNTQAMLSNSAPYVADTTGAAYAASQFRGPNNLSDWFLPSIDELGLMDTQIAALGLINTNPPAYGYWSSTSVSTNSGRAYVFEFDNHFSQAPNKNTTSPAVYVRPIRAF